MQGNLMIQLNGEEAAYLLRRLKEDIRTDLVCKLVEKLEVGMAVQEAAYRGATGEQRGLDGDYT